MSITKLVAAYNAYTNKFGMVDAEQGRESQNMIRFTSEALVAFRRYHEKVGFELNQKPMFLKKAERMLIALHSCQVQEGLLARRPDGSGGQEGPDDYYGAVTVSPNLATRFLEYGKNNRYKICGDYPKNNNLNKVLFYVLKVLYRVFTLKAGIPYCYNNENQGHFTLSAWLGRQLPLIATAKFSSPKHKPNFIDKIAFCAGLTFAAFDKSADGKVLSNFMVISAEGKSSICDIFIRAWRYKFKKQYPGGLGEVLANYYSVGKYHPNSVYLQGEFGQTRKVGEK